MRVSRPFSRPVVRLVLLLPALGALGGLAGGPAQAAAPPPTRAHSGHDVDWDDVARCESAGDWR